MDLEKHLEIDVQNLKHLSKKDYVDAVKESIKNNQVYIDSDNSGKSKLKVPKKDFIETPTKDEMIDFILNEKFCIYINDFTEDIILKDFKEIYPFFKIDFSNERLDISLSGKDIDYQIDTQYYYTKMKFMFKYFSKINGKLVYDFQKQIDESNVVVDY